MTTATIIPSYDHPMLYALCAESGITVADLSDCDNLRADVYSDCGCLDAVEPSGDDTADTYLTRVCDAVAAGDVAATLAMRRMFGLFPIV